MELHNGDLAGIPPSGWLANFVCKIIHAQTFHWTMIIGRDKDGYITSESLGKGTSVSRFVYPRAYIYRIKSLKHEPETSRLISFHSWQGDKGYDMQVNFLSGIWFLLKHYLKIAIPVIHNNKYNCQEFVVYMAYCLGAKIIPENEYPYCVNIEKSEYLEYKGEFCQK
jgi:hypothetical protein